MIDRIHPESMKQIRALVRLHGFARVREAIDQIEQQETNQVDRFCERFSTRRENSR